jgi:HSP20 family protein
MVTHLLTFGPIWDQQELFTTSSLWNRLQQLQGGMNALPDRRNADAGQKPDSSYPAVNMWQDADAVHVEVELPGLEQEELEIYITGDNQLTMAGERKEKVPEKGILLRQERGLGRFARAVTLPLEVDRDKVEARLENGILLVKLAKKESSKPRQVIVKRQ